MLTGPFECDYCKLHCAQRERFSVWHTETVTSGTFCQPECAAAYNRYCMHTDAGCQERHALLEFRYKRRIQCAPTRKQIHQENMQRSEWLATCREQLDDEERHVVEQQMVVVTTTEVYQRNKKQ